MLPGPFTTINSTRNATTVFRSTYLGSGEIWLIADEGDDHFLVEDSQDGYNKLEQTKKQVVLITAAAYPVNGVKINISGIIQ